MAGAFIETPATKVLLQLRFLVLNFTPYQHPKSERFFLMFTLLGSYFSA